MPKLIVRLLCAIIIIVGVPMALSNFNFSQQNVYADTGTCCQEVGSTCVIGKYAEENAYYKSEGPCSPH